MLDFVYRRRVARDLPDWVARGWVAPGKADALLDSIPGGDLRDRLPGIVAVFGAVLLALGVMSFVAANWNGISRLLRLVMLFGLCGPPMAAPSGSRPTAGPGSTRPR